MKRYLDHIKSKPAHDRRTHAMQLSGGIVAVLFVVWISTLSYHATIAPQTADGDQSQLANVVSGAGGQQATLIVATTTQY